MKYKINLFHPYVPKSAGLAVAKTLKGRWLGQGPRVAEFEKLWQSRISGLNEAVAVSSGIASLHLAYILAGIDEGSEVIAPIFTYPGANMALLYQKAKIIFSDVKKDSLNIDAEDIAKKITKNTKAMVVVHYGGVACDMDSINRIAIKHRIPVISDAAYGHGTYYNQNHISKLSDFTGFSFQAVKMINTGSGGMLTIKNSALVQRAKTLRQMAVGQKPSLDGRGEQDIKELGYRYQMTDLQASLGIAALESFDETLQHYENLSEIYRENLTNVPGIKYIGGNSLCIVLADDRRGLKAKLQKHGIESSQVDFRNDRYSIFGGRVATCPNMDSLEDKYLILPQHRHLTPTDVTNICKVIKK